MQHLKMFKNLQFNLDHGFFKNFVCQFIEEDQVMAKARTVDKMYDIQGLETSDQIV